MAGLLPEFAGAEFASVEFATGGKNYADIAGSASLAFVGAGSIGRVVSVVGTATLGATSDGDFTAVTATMSEEFMAFSPYAPGSVYFSTDAGAYWSFTGDGRASALATVDGAGSLAFTSIAYVIEDALGDAYMRFDGYAVTAAIARTVGSANWQFVSSGQAQAIAATESQSLLRMQASASMTAVASTGGTGSVAFSGLARSQWWAAADALASAQFIANGQASAVWRVAGAASMAFNGVAVGSWREFTAMAGAATFAFVSDARTQAPVSARGQANLTFQGSAAASMVRESRGIAQFGFTGSGVVGRPVLRSMPLAYDVIVRPTEDRSTGRPGEQRTTFRPAEDRESDWQ